MRKLPALLTLALVLIASQSRAANPPDPIQILFIGNSLTHRNDLPKMLTEMARAGQQRAIVTVQETPGGCTLEKHWKDGKALAKIESKKWDYVVVQEQSQAPFAKHDSFVEYGKRFDEAIRKNGAKMILYETWANSDQPQNQALLTKAYADLAKETSAILCPAGEAWKAALTADNKLALHVADKKHPTPAGTYLAACVFYATIYNKSPEGLPGDIAKLPQEQARQLQQIAWKTAHPSAE